MNTNMGRPQPTRPYLRFIQPLSLNFPSSYMTPVASHSIGSFYLLSSSLPNQSNEAAGFFTVIRNVSSSSRPTVSNHPPNQQCFIFRPTNSAFPFSQLATSSPAASHLGVCVISTFCRAPLSTNRMPQRIVSSRASSLYQSPPTELPCTLLPTNTVSSSLYVSSLHQTSNDLSSRYLT